MWCDTPNADKVEVKETHEYAKKEISNEALQEVIRLSGHGSAVVIEFKKYHLYLGNCNVTKDMYDLDVYLVACLPEKHSRSGMLLGVILGEQKGAFGTVSNFIVGPIEKLTDVDDSYRVALRDDKIYGGSTLAFSIFIANTEIVYSLSMLDSRPIWRILDVKIEDRSFRCTQGERLTWCGEKPKSFTWQR